MKKKIYILCFIIIGVLFIAGCGSSGGGDSNQEPVISNLLFSPSSALLGQEDGSVTVTGYVDFVDTDGDLATLRITSSAGVDITIPITGIDGQTRGTINGIFDVSTESIGTYSFEVWLVDSQGNSSNKLSGTFEVKEGSEDFTSIIDEQHIMNDTSDTFLANDDVDINSILVTDSLNNILLEDIHYTLVETGGFTGIRCKPGLLDCSSGVQVLVDYRFKSETIGSFLTKRSALGGFNARGNAAQPDVDFLPSQVSLIDDDFFTSTGIDISTLITGQYQNLGIRVSGTKPVDTIYVYVNQDVTGDLLNKVSGWKAYSSNTNINVPGSWTERAIQSVSVSLHDLPNSIYRFEIKLLSEVTASYFKIINMLPASTVNVSITEIEAYGTDLEVNAI
jgi:hypothetical protein